MRDDRPWVEKMMEIYHARAPRDEEFGKIHDGIGTLITRHLGGLDHRKAGNLAAEMYEYVMSLRQQVVEDMGEIALGTIGQEKLAKMLEERGE